MFATRFYPNRFFPNRYFPHVGGAATAAQVYPFVQKGLPALVFGESYIVFGDSANIPTLTDFTGRIGMCAITETAVGHARTPNREPVAITESTNVEATT